MKKGLLVLGVCALLTSVSATANPLAKDQAVLRLDGIDLSTADGQQRLAIRMDAAARAVCGDRLSSVHLATAAKAEACRTAVIADIRDQIETHVAKAETASSTRLASSL